jgi:hypothetical protein
MTIKDKKMFYTTVADISNLLGHYMFLVTNNEEEYEELAETVSSMLTVLVMSVGGGREDSKQIGKYMKKRRRSMKDEMKAESVIKEAQNILNNKN